MQIDETVHGCPDGYRGGLPARQLGHPVSASQIRTTSGQLPLVAAAGGAMKCILWHSISHAISLTDWIWYPDEGSYSSQCCSTLRSSRRFGQKGSYWSFHWIYSATACSAQIGGRSPQFSTPSVEEGTP